MGAQEVFRVGDLVELRPDWENPEAMPELRPNNSLKAAVSRMKWPARIVKFSGVRSDLVELEGLEWYSDAPNPRRCINFRRLRLAVDSVMARIMADHQTDQEKQLKELREQLGIDPIPAG